VARSIVQARSTATGLMPRAHCVTIPGLTSTARANDAALPSAAQAAMTGFVLDMRWNVALLSSYRKAMLHSKAFSIASSWDAS
jgi:hypothetical protein